MFLNKDLQLLEGQEEFFHGNSKITSDCRVGSILKTLLENVNHNSQCFVFLFEIKRIRNIVNRGYF